jgi:hypothetical protein
MAGEARPSAAVGGVADVDALDVSEYNEEDRGASTSDDAALNA